LILLDLIEIDITDLTTKDIINAYTLRFTAFASIINTAPKISPKLFLLVSQGDHFATRVGPYLIVLVVSLVVG